MVILPFCIEAEAVIFDFDGVIVDTEPLHYNAFQKVLSAFGITFSWDEYVERYIGFDDRDAFKEAFREKGCELTHDLMQQLISSKADAFVDSVRDGVNPYPGVVELVKRISGSGTPLAIASGALRSDIDPVIRLLGIENCFNAIVTADEVARSKPDPESYAVALARLEKFAGKSFDHARVFAIEDTPAGIASAKGAGISVIGVTNSYRREKLAGADAVLDTLQY